MEELLKQILEENKKLVNGQLRIEEENKKLVNVQLRIEEENKKLVNGQVRMEKLQNSMAKDIKAIKDYQHKGLDIDIEKLQSRVKIIEETLKIS